MAGVKKEFIHGHSYEREHKIWRGMVGRCHHPQNKDFKGWGARGIKVCDRWRFSYENFLEDMGRAPVRKSIDRINNDGDYEPGNCRWATHKEQSNNMRVKKEIEGQRFGMWYVIAYTDKKKPGRHYICRCDCGTVKIIVAISLRAGRTTKCSLCQYSILYGEKPIIVQERKLR